MKKRMRVFAGPNGSGKSTLVGILSKNRISLGVYCNADEYKLNINKSHYFDFADMGLTPSWDYFIKSFHESTLYNLADGENLLGHIDFLNGKLLFDEHYQVNDYFTSFLSSFVRENLLGKSEKFTFETVMSHPSKLSFMEKAHDCGYKVYLYFVALANYEMNIARVKSRVQAGGHDVPEEKVKSRYEKCMDLLFPAISIADESYIFDNSGEHTYLIAEVKKSEMKVLVDEVPMWFNDYVLKKI